MVSAQKVREDFDRIALLAEQHGGAAGDAYHGYLLKQLPAHIGKALEVGCGAGEFTRLLVARARSVVALDLSPQMICLAEAQTDGCGNVEYRLCDFMRLSLPAEEFDCIVSIATLHHLPLAEAVLKMKKALRPGGVLLIHDLTADEGVADFFRSALAWAAGGLRRFLRTGRVREPREVREAWEEHGKGEVYLTPAEVREMCEKYLPSARVKRHLMWRYTVVWRKEAETK